MALQLLLPSLSFIGKQFCSRQKPYLEGPQKYATVNAQENKKSYRSEKGNSLS